MAHRQRSASRIGQKGLILAALLLVLAILSYFPGLTSFWDRAYRFAGLTPQSSAKAAFKEAAFLSVGQGDCALLVSGDNEMLIDTGPPSGAEEITAELHKRGVVRIEYMLLTHPHDDHIGGAKEIFEQFEVETVIMNDLVPEKEADKKKYDQLMQAIDEEQADIIYPQDNQTLYVGDILVTLYLPILQSADENENSIITYADLGDFALLLMGDAGAPCEKALMAGQYTIAADALKIGHHGSATASTAAFLRAVSPQYAVISVGKNGYGHPTREVTDRLDSLGIPYYRTDQHGTVCFGQQNQAWAVDIDRAA